MTTDEFIRSRPPLDLPATSHLQPKSWRGLFFWLEVILLAVCLAEWCSTFYFSLDAAWVLLLVPVAWVGMAVSCPDLDESAQRRTFRNRRKLFYPEVPQELRVVLSVLMLAAFANFLLTMGSIDGTPEYRSGQYVLAHKSQPPDLLTKDQYVMLTREYDRACSGLGSVVSLAAALSLGLHLRRP